MITRAPGGRNYAALVDKDSEAYRTWTGQASRLGSTIETALPQILEAHARRDVAMESREPATKMDLYMKVSALPPDQIVSRALKDFNERSQIPDAEIHIPGTLPAILSDAPRSSAGIKPTHTFMVYEAKTNPDGTIEADKTKPVNYPLGYRASEVAGWAAGHIWGTLVQAPAKKVDGYPELPDVHHMRMSEIVPKLQNMENSRVGLDLDMKVAQMGVGYYVYQQKYIRVFGNISDPNVRLIREDEWSSGDESKVLRTKDELKNQIVLAAGDITTALQNAPTGMDMEWIIKRKRGDNLTPENAYYGLGYLVASGAVEVTGEGKKLMVNLKNRPQS